MYSAYDIDEFLIEARKQKENVMSKIKELSFGEDAKIIEYAINESDFFAEDFNSYDSDVCEQFLQLMELVGIAKWYQSIDFSIRIIKEKESILALFNFALEK